MKFFKYEDCIEEGSYDCEDRVIKRSTTFVNYDQISCIKFFDDSPYFTVYFSDEKLLEIDKKHLKKFLEGIK